MMVLERPIKSVLTAVGLKIEIHEIHQNLRNPVSTNRNPLPTTKSNSAERKLNIEIQRKLQRNQRIPRKPELPKNSTPSYLALIRTLSKEQWSAC